MHLSPEEGGLHGEIPDTPENREFFLKLSLEAAWNEIRRLREQVSLLSTDHVLAEELAVIVAQLEKRAEIALSICNSEPFMWLMVGSNHPEMQLNALRNAWSEFKKAGGGWPQQ